MKNIIREVIEIDRLARVNEEKAQKEKETLDEFIKTERKKLIAQYHEDMNHEIALAKKQYQDEIQRKTQELQHEYDITIANLNKQFNENKEQWIENIYQYCIKE